MRNLTPTDSYVGDAVMRRHRSAFYDDVPVGRCPQRTGEDDSIPAHAFAPRPTPADIARRNEALQELALHLVE